MNRAGKFILQSNTRGIYKRVRAVLSWSMALIGIFVMMAGLFILPAVEKVHAFTPPETLTSYCTATLLSGSFSVQPVASRQWQTGTNGMVLEVGSIVRTDEGSNVMLTFFEGSTIVLEPKTEIVIEKITREYEGNTIILIRQFCGMTWNMVEKMIDVRSRYEIQTPSANAVVRGTFFSVYVGKDGSTQVRVGKGMVAVNAQGVEVMVPAGFLSTVNTGKTPTAAEKMAEGAMDDYPAAAIDAKNADSNSSVEGPHYTMGSDKANGSDGTASGDKSEKTKSSNNMMLGDVVMLVIALAVIGVMAKVATKM